MKMRSNRRTPILSQVLESWSQGAELKDLWTSLPAAPDHDAEDVEEEVAEADLDARLAPGHDGRRESRARRADVGPQRQRQPHPVQGWLGSTH